MAVETKNCGFIVIRANLGARQEFEVIADPGVNTLDRDAKYACRTNDGTQQSVFVSVLQKLAQAINSGSPRIQLDVDNTEIVG